MKLCSEDETNTCKSVEWHWGLKLGEVARIWKDGCIIRAIFLHRIKRHMTGIQSWLTSWSTLRIWEWDWSVSFSSDEVILGIRGDQNDQNVHYRAISKYIQVQEGAGSSKPVYGDDRLDQPVPTVLTASKRKLLRRSRDAVSYTSATTECSSPQKRPRVQKHAHSNSNITHSRV
ncbi:hypothetical protein Tco_0593790 [Tanacetum coccineum]